MTTKNAVLKGLKNVKVLIDTNVILDVLCNRQQFIKESETVCKMCETKLLSGSICALSILNLVYILRKELNPQGVKSVVDRLYLIFNIEDLKSNDTKKAADMQWSDYEDAVQAVCADRISADYIITRNTVDFKDSRVEAITPTELLNIIKSGA